MKMYVVLSQEDVWEADICVIGVYSTREKAQAIIDGVGKETFPNDVMWIVENEVDTFDWEREEDE